MKNLRVSQFVAFAFLWIATGAAEPSEVSEGRSRGLDRRMPASLSTIIGDQGMAAQLGGDDVAIAAGNDAGQSRIQIADNGTILVAVSKDTHVDVYRSTDGGDTWSLWSTFDDPAAATFFTSSFVVAEGTFNRVLIGYTIFSGTGQGRVAYADLAAAVPAWTIVTAFVEAGVNFTSVSLDTDEEAFDSYYIYAAAAANDANGPDVWFTRSTNQGVSYAAEYRIVNNTAGLNVVFGAPEIRFGSGNWIHVLYDQRLLGGMPQIDGLHTKRAANWADGGLASWGAQLTLNPNGDMIPAKSMGFEASLVDGTVIAIDRTQLRYSTDFGATWPGANSAILPVVPSNDLAIPIAISATGAVAVLAGEPGGCSLCLDEMLLLRSTTADLETWTPSYESRLSVHPAAPTNITHRPSLAIDPSRGGRHAAVWWIDDFSTDTNDVVRFDAEWRRDPGYANTEVGFPIALAGGQTPPAVAQVDQDVQLEIVFGTIDGNVHVLNHNGTSFGSWPVDIGNIPFDAPVAVGDLVGNGVVSVVAGNQAGVVHAFDWKGVPLAGWPYDMGTGAPVYVSIGALGPPNPRYVVAVSGTKMRILNYQGENVAPPWIDIPFGTYNRPAAIGNLDADGVAEIVSLAGPNVYRHRLNEAVFWGQQFPGETFSDAPTLADVDGDGDLEIAAPTASGKLYLLNHDLLEVAPWPITFTPGVALTSVAFAHFFASANIELAFAQADGVVRAVEANGTPLPGWPEAVVSPVFMPPMLYPINLANISHVNMGAVNAVANSWRNFSATVVPGWPRNLPGPVEETFAAGDIDNDGRTEIVVLGVNFLTVFDVGIGPSSMLTMRWPMYGHDAQRTGCLACIETLSAAGDAPTIDGRLALSVSPNPFNPMTLVEYEVEAAGPVTLEVYDVAGRHVETLVDQNHDAGRYSLRYQPDIASGVYFIKLAAGGESTVRKIVLLK